MKSYKPLQDAFARLNMSTIQWYKSARFPRSVETVNAILHRGSAVDASTVAYLACCLDIPNKQIIAILEDYAKENPKKASEVAVLKRLIAPVELSKAEQEFSELLRKLPDEKRKLVYALAGSL